ncbi:unnamed protein product [Mytilus coruscus]|uniref:Uncharacterized protein n=1 Tax=Mytilus coruscus TaxID=42192 RepID=A0A6J8AV60_MYTCO|nr:unnamed protein product [Mytilus coruscus]
MQVATKTKLQLNDILVFLDIDNSRENLCKVVSFALEQKDALKEEDTVTEKPPKIEKKKKLKLQKTNRQGFHIHKNRPNFAAALLLKLVCNKEEEAVLDKEQKLLKIFGKNDVQSDNYNMQSHNLYLHAAGLMGGSFEQAQGQTDGMPPRFLGSPRRQTVVERQNNGSIKCVGKVGLVKPPHIEAPLTVEPTKHRLCGALVCEITPRIERLTRTQPPRLIFIHEGVNNVSKSFLFKNEFNQLLSTTQQFEHLAQMLQ